MKHLAKVGDGAYTIAARRVGLAAMDAGPDIVRVAPNGFAVIGDGPREITLAEMHVGAIEPQRTVLGTEANGFGEIGDGPVVVLGLRVRKAPIGRGFEVARLDTKGLGIIRDGLRQVAIADVEHGPAAQQPGILGPKFERLAEIGNGGGQLALPCQGVGAVDERPQVGRIGLERCRMLGHGDGMQVAFDLANQVVRRQPREPVEHRAEVLRPSRLHPRRTIVEQRLPFFGEQDAVAGIGIGSSGQCKGAHLPKGEDVGVRADPNLPLGPTDDFRRGVGDGARDAAAQRRLHARGGVAGRGVNERALKTKAGIEQLDSPDRAALRRFLSSQEDAARPQAPVQHAAVVGCLQGAGHGPRHGEPLLRRKRAVAGNLLGQRQALEVFGDEERPVAIVADLAESSKTGNARMVEFLHRDQVVDHGAHVAVEAVAAESADDDREAGGPFQTMKGDAKSASAQDALRFVARERKRLAAGVERHGAAQGGQRFGGVTAFEGGAIGVMVGFGLTFRVGNEARHFLKVLLAPFQFADDEFELRQAVEQRGQPPLVVARQVAKAANQILYCFPFGVAPQGKAIARPHGRRMEVVAALEVADRFVQLAIGLAVLVLFRLDVQHVFSSSSSEAQSMQREFKHFIMLDRVELAKDDTTIIPIVDDYLRSVTGPRLV